MLVQWALVVWRGSLCFTQQWLEFCPLEARFLLQTCKEAGETFRFMESLGVTRSLHILHNGDIHSPGRRLQ
jgi:hypothetical protein